ncbi:MAG: PqqD family protein [Prosthecobacter sp.]|uniref:PqqD family protein n=1 Tax=Prosthecobacter sp. TaxID=1965333 RepID=UPI003904477D
MNPAPPPALPRHNGHQSPAIIPILPVTPSTSGFTFHTVTWQADGFGFDATTGEFFTASPTALLVMQSLSEKLNRQQILDRITATFEVARSTAERDLESFLAELAHLGLTSEH